MERYLILIEKAGNNFSAYAPDLPGCVATGATVEETRRTMREAIDFHIEGLKRENLPVPEASVVADWYTAREDDA